MHCKPDMLDNNNNNIRNSWEPEENSAVPFRQEGSKRRKFVYHWLTTYQWLAYSKAIDGCFYLPCMLFGLRSGHNTAKQVRLISEPLIYWTSASSRLRSHETSMLHHNAVVQMQDFETMMQKQQHDIHIGQNG